MIRYVTIVVDNYDAAIAYYTRLLDYVVREDTSVNDNKRWVVVGSADGQGCGLLLAQASTPTQQAHIGNQTGGRVAFFYQTADFAATYARMQAMRVHFLEAPRHEAYGWVVQFVDIYGNKWDLLGA
jgi:predicted enzyme related to lactoylglutathione lyase